MADDRARRAARRRLLRDWGVVIGLGLIVTLIGIVAIVVILTVVSR